MDKISISPKYIVKLYGHKIHPSDIEVVIRFAEEMESLRLKNCKLEKEKMDLMIELHNEKLKYEEASGK